MLIGYMRVSKTDGSQNTDLQRDALISAGVGNSYIYEDFCSGSLDGRPSLDAALKALREGDTLVVWKLDRLGRSMIHTAQLAQGFREGGIGFKSLKDSVDTSTASGRMMRKLRRMRARADCRAHVRRAGARAGERRGGRP